MISPRGRKALKTAVLTGSRTSGVIALSRWLTRHGFNIVGFHGVSLQDEHVRFPTLFISPETFERRLQFVMRHYRVVPLDEVIQQHRRGRIQPNQIVLTFDDGFHNFLGRAIPIMKKHGVHATAYVVTADVVSGEPLFNLMVKDLFLSTPRSMAADLPHAPGETFDLRTIQQRNALTTTVLAAMEDTCTTASSRLAYCQAVADALDVDLESRLRGRIWHRLTPDEVQQVTAEGFGVQLHTHSHRNVLGSRNSVRDELRTNRQILERLSGTSANHFCYPLGLWSRSVWDDLIAEGVETAVTTRNGPNYRQTPLLALRRYLTGEAMSDLEFEFGLSGLRWLVRAAIGPTARFTPSEKLVRYSEQPDLY